MRKTIYFIRTFIQNRINSIAQKTLELPQTLKFAKKLANTQTMSTIIENHRRNNHPNSIHRIVSLR